MSPADEKLEATRGAVLAEFVITVVPLLMMLFGWLQLSWLYTANVLVQHAANTCARAAIVIDDKPFNPGDNGSVADIQKATERAAEVQGNGKKAFKSIRCDVTNAATEQDEFGKVTAKVTAEFKCGVPMGKFIVCGPTASKTLTKSAELPFQGARYEVAK
jgi:Flp pilus assembly protein TadG